MELINRQLREIRQGMPVVIGQAVEKAKSEIIIEAGQGKMPAAPVELLYQTALYLDPSSGAQLARVIVDFPDVAIDTSGDPLEVTGYELWGKDESANALAVTTSAAPGLAAPGVTVPGLAATAANKAIAESLATGWERLSTSAESAFSRNDFLPGSIWRFRVRAMAGRTEGAWSAETVVSMEADSTPPPQPSEPVLTVARGTITVRWDGLSVLGAMPADFVHLEVAQGSSSSPEGVVARFYRGGGVFVASGFPYYTPQYFRFRAVDQSGNKSPWSAQGVGYTTPLVDTDIILSKLDAAETLLVNVDAGVSILSDTIATRHLAVTEDMTVRLLAAHKVQAGEIDVNSLFADSAFVGSLQAEVVDSVVVTAEMIQAGALDGAVITGPLIQTARTGARTVLDTAGVKSYDDAGNELVRLGHGIATGLAVRSPATGSMIPISALIFGTPPIENKGSGFNIGYTDSGKPYNALFDAYDLNRPIPRETTVVYPTSSAELTWTISPSGDSDFRQNWTLVWRAQVWLVALEGGEPERLLFEHDFTDYYQATAFPPYEWTEKKLITGLTPNRPYRFRSIQWKIGSTNEPPTWSRFTRSQLVTSRAL